ncbi:Cytochrome P450 [Rhynchospora pubera]|uniref:Cytochrome P450 n=1 Tax=Rhynchospora pubera TaxID=906938 RepID=A0AAV8CI67_9POAL|nr:Cytochrome P450 [Rhynchospora pubera]
MTVTLVLSSLLTVFLLSLLLCLQYLKIKNAAKSQSKIKLPPGPSTIPFFGNLHHLAKSCPHHALHDLARTHGPIMLFHAGVINLLVLSSSEAAKEVMKVQDAKFSNRPTLTATKAILYGCTDIAFSSGPYWRQLRRICVTELLSTKRVKYFSSIRQYEIHCMLKTLSTFSNDSTPVNLGAKASELTNNIVLRAAFGGNCRTQAKFLKISKEAVQSASWFCLSDIFSALSWFDVKTRRKFARIHRYITIE